MIHESCSPTRSRPQVTLDISAFSGRRAGFVAGWETSMASDAPDPQASYTPSPHAAYLDAAGLVTFVLQPARIVTVEVNGLSV